jgi:hypothetical protein
MPTCFVVMGYGKKVDFATPVIGATQTMANVSRR